MASISYFIKIKQPSADLIGGSKKSKLPKLILTVFMIVMIVALSLSGLLIVTLSHRCLDPDFGVVEFNRVAAWSGFGHQTSPI